MDADLSEERILILAPTGRDSEVLRLVLGRVGLTVAVCDTIDAVVAELEGPIGTGTLVLAEEALAPGRRSWPGGWQRSRPGAICRSSCCARTWRSWMTSQARPRLSSSSATYPCSSVRCGRKR